MKLEIRELDPAELYRFFRLSVEGPVFGYAARDGIKTVAIGGVLFDEGGRAWTFLDFLPGRRGPWLYRYARKTLEIARELALESVSAVRDEQFSSSERLLTRLGFRRTDETIDGKEVWIWLASQE